MEMIHAAMTVLGATYDMMEAQMLCGLITLHMLALHVPKAYQVISRVPFIA